MAKRSGAMHVARVVRKHGDREYVSHLLRKTYREDGKVRHETLGNISSMEPEAIEVLRGVLAGKHYVEAGESVTVSRSLPHGHVAAVGAMAKKLKLAELLGLSCSERDIVMGLVISRICSPSSKLATSQWWSDTTLASDLGLSDVRTDQIYDAMDWLYERQGSIEKKLAGRHLKDGGFALYDLSSSWMEGKTCPLSARGHSRDGKRGKLQIEYGLLTDKEGRPVSIEVFSGNTGDPTAFVAAVDNVRKNFGLVHMVMVGDRGMITSARIAEIDKSSNLSWVSALKGPQIKALLNKEAFQLSLFDETNLAEITHEDYPGERLVVCRNPALKTKREATRRSMLCATEEKLEKIQARVKTGKLSGKDKIGTAVGKVINSHKMAKHFTTKITDKRFTFERDQQSIDAEAATDGIYIVRTKVPADVLATNDVVDTYKSLANVERDFRSMKVDDLDLRPIYHRLDERVRAHVFICMLAEYLIWHLREAWSPLTFKDDEPPTHADPVSPKTRSAQAAAKAASKSNTDGYAIRNFQGLLAHMATLTRNTMNVAGGVTYETITSPTPEQRRAFELIGATQTPLTVL